MESIIQSLNLAHPLSLAPVNLVHCIYLTIALFGFVLSLGKPRLKSLRIILALTAGLLIFNLMEEQSQPRILITPLFTLGFGPAFYWFCQQLVYGDAPDNRRIALHLSPMLLALPFTGWPQLIIALGSLSQLVYLSKAIGLMNLYHRMLNHISSNTEAASLNWLKWILIILLVMMIQDLARLNLQPYAPLGWLQLWYFLNTCGYALLASYLILMALNKPGAFEHFKEMEQLLQATDTKTDADDANAGSLFAQVDTVVRSQQLYLQSRFSLRDLASATGLQERQLSWIINQGGQLSFSDYINQLRVRAVCEQLTESLDTNILETAMAAGFSSKSAFNLAFKKYTGLTPSNYCKNLQSNSELKGVES